MSNAKIEPDEGTTETEAEHEHQTAEGRCPRCGRKATPDPKTVWSGVVAQIVHDTWNIAIAVAGIGVAYTIIFGTPDAAAIAMGVAFFVATVAADALAVIHKLMAQGFPFRAIDGTGPLSD